MLTNFFIARGWSRDDFKWLAIQIVAVAGLITSGVIDVPYWAAYLGLHISVIGLHWIQVVAIVALWIAGKYDSSSLPSKRAMASGTVPGSPLPKILPMLLACALAGGLLMLSACAANRPPAGTYTVADQKTFDAVQLLKDVRAFSQTAINLNGTSGKLHLSDADTALVRDFALTAGDALQSYGNGQESLATVQTALNTLNRKLSAEAKVNQKLKAALALVAAGVSAIPPSSLLEVPYAA